MADSKKDADDGILTTTAQAIGSTLGKLATKTGIVKPTPKPTLRRKPAVAKKLVAKKKPAKKVSAARPAKKSK